MTNNWVAALTVSLTGAGAGCIGDDSGFGTDEGALVSGNKVSLNKVSLNKVSLNKVSLNKVSLNAVGVGGATVVDGYLEVPTATLSTPINDPLLAVTATPVTDGYMVAFDGAPMFIELDGGALGDLVEKSAKCINPPGIKTNYAGQAFDGTFGLGTRGLTPEQFVESYMSCLAIFANDESVMINVTADLPAANPDVKSTSEEFTVYRVPDVAVAFRVTSTLSGANTRFAGNWYWNLSRHSDWSAAAINLWGWQAMKGRRPLPLETERACLEALRARQPMPEICGGDESRVWKGVVTPGLVVPPGSSSTVVCSSRMVQRPYPPSPGTFEYNDYTKGVGCGATAANGEMSAVFYAELRFGLSFVEVNWARAEAEAVELIAARPPTGDAGTAFSPDPGSGSGSGSSFFDAGSGSSFVDAGVASPDAGINIGADGGGP